MKHCAAHSWIALVLLWVSVQHNLVRATIFSGASWQVIWVLQVHFNRNQTVASSSRARLCRMSCGFEFPCFLLSFFPLLHRFFEIQVSDMKAYFLLFFLKISICAVSQPDGNVSIVRPTTLSDRVKTPGLRRRWIRVRQGCWESCEGEWRGHAGISIMFCLVYFLFFTKCPQVYFWGLLEKRNLL